MTEKQRWLLRDLDAWQKKQMERIGFYGPRTGPKAPPHVREAQRVSAAAHTVIRKWEAERKQPWQAAKTAIEKRVQEVKRVILFEKTDAALKALRSLKG